MHLLIPRQDRINGVLLYSSRENFHGCTVIRSRVFLGKKERDILLFINFYFFFFLYLARKKGQRLKLYLLSVRQVDWKVHSNKFQWIIGVFEFYQMILQIRICNGRNKHGVKIQQDEGRKSIVVQVLVLEWVCNQTASYPGNI